MKVGDTFFFDGSEFSIKMIDTTSSEKFPSGRVDASKFTGSYDDPENPRAIQRGRPKGFELSDVADILGETIPAPTIKSDVTESESISSAWDTLRDSDNESVSESLPETTPSTTMSTSGW